MTTDNPNASPQRFSALPQFNAPMVDPKTGLVSQAWQWAITALWYKAGSTFSDIPTASYPKQQPGLPITLHDAQTGNLIGQMITGIEIDLPADEFNVVETTDAEGNPVFTVTWKDQVKNLVFAGPPTDPSAPPTFRVLVSDDLPIATLAEVGAVKPDGTSITILPDGTISASGGGGTGDVVGPASAVDSDFAQFDGTTGKLIKDGGLSLDTDGTMAADSDLHVPSQKAVVTYVNDRRGFGFFIGGLMSVHELLGSCVYPEDMNFVNGDALNVVECRVPANADADITFAVANPGGVPTPTPPPVVGTLHFPAGSYNGAVTWSTSPFTLLADSILLMFAPTVQDPSLALITGSIHGSSS